MTAPVRVQRIDAEDLETEGTAILKNLDGILIPGGFGDRGIEGKILAAQFAREEGIPYFGLCLGMQNSGDRICPPCRGSQRSEQR